MQSFHWASAPLIDSLILVSTTTQPDRANNHVMIPDTELTSYEAKTEDRILER